MATLCLLSASCLDVEPQGAGPVRLHLSISQLHRSGLWASFKDHGAPLLDKRFQGQPRAQGGGAQTLSHIQPVRQDSYLEMEKCNIAVPSSRAVLLSATRWGCCIKSGSLCLDFRV